MRRIEVLRSEFKNLRPEFEKLIHLDAPYERLIAATQGKSSGMQELMVSLVLEPNGEVVDGLCECMEDTFGSRLDPLMTVGDMQNLLGTHYEWALNIDLSQQRESAMVWYVSEEKLEPRMGERSADHEERREMPHAIPHKVQALAKDLDKFAPDTLLAEVLMAHPQHRDISRRVQTIARHPYGEFHDNLVAADVRPIDLLRCKLSFFGASKFDPRSDRWTRITLYQGAPTARELTPQNCADVFLPAFGTA